MKARRQLENQLAELRQTTLRDTERQYMRAWDETLALLSKVYENLPIGRAEYETVIKNVRAMANAVERGATAQRIDDPALKRYIVEGRMIADRLEEYLEHHGD